MGPFPELFSSFSIDGLRLKNRIVMAAMGNNLSHPQGIVSDQAIAYYRERARGGVGLIITEACPVSLAGRHRGQSICIHDDSFVPGLKRLTNAVHEQGSGIAVQLHHAGRLAYPKISGELPLAPSPIPRAPGLMPPKELDCEEIQEIVDQFGIAARRAKAAGFDAVEIHGAHGYLIHQFLSPRTNQRKDEYGGSPQNRARFALKVLQKVREEAGDFFPVIFRVSVREFIPGGYSLEESADLAAELERSGASVLHISGGTTESIPGLSHVIPPMEFPEAYHIPLASVVKKKAALPLIAVGRLGNPVVAEEVLRAGQADLIALGRPLLSDPFWPVKAARGETHRIRHCVACNYCIWRLTRQERITCFQNASVAHEEEYRIQPAERPKK
ncbi:MAG TPA: NADH:flavin oxidoreductase, partial [Thermodesulfobacteriota bacterium]|nr:NADH:flavin oxidoreductase [Thermodesulfobacteriota bacterium]